MSVEVGTAYVSIVPSAKGFAGKLQSELGGGLTSAGTEGGKRFGGGMLAATKGLVGPLAGIFAATKAVDFLKDSIAEARESQKVGALTTQVIKSTGGAAKVTASQVGDLATAISNKTGIDDEAIQSASNLLLTFTNVRNEVGKGNDVFNQATQIATDMGAALGGDPKQSAIQLGKALNDPVKGISALQRVGVSFTAQQQNQIKTLVKSGDTLGAQKVILGELNKEFGGAAAASATAGEKFSTTFGNFKEAIGTALLPALDAVLGKASGFVSFLTANMGPAFDRVRSALQPVGDVLNVFFTALGNGEVTTQGFLGQVGNLAYALRDAFLQTLPRVESFLRSVWAVVQTQVVPAIKAFGGYLLANVVPVLMTVGRIIVTQVVPAIIALATFIYTRVYPAIFAIVLAIATRLRPVLTALFSVIATRVIPVIQLIAAKFREWWPTIQKVITVVIAIIGWVLKLAASILGKVLPVIIRLAGFLLTVVVKAIIGVIEGVARFIGALIRFGVAVYNAGQRAAEFARTVADKVGQVISFFVTLPGRIVSALGNLGSTLISAGGDLIGGFIQGLKNRAGDIVATIKSTITDKLPAFVKKALGIQSPSRVFMELGAYTAQGMALGISSGASSVQDAADALVPAARSTGRASVTVGGGGSGGSQGPGRLHPHDIALLADAMAARPTILDGRQVSKSQDRALVLGVMP